MLCGALTQRISLKSFTDSVILYGLAWRMGEVAGMRVFAKMSLKKWPVIGWMWSYLNFIFLTRFCPTAPFAVPCVCHLLTDVRAAPRNLQKDAPMIKKQLEVASILPRCECHAFSALPGADAALPLC
eukprot:1471604-Rhodomonas_salina.4